MQDEQIMAIALLKVKYLDSIIIPYQLSELLNFFNMHSTKSQIRKTLLQVKKTVSFILLIERQHYTEYLKLPKFNTLQHNTRHKIVTYFGLLWNCFMMQKQAIGPGSLKEINQIITPMENLNHFVNQSNPKSHHQMEFHHNFNYYPQFTSNNYQIRNNGSERINYPMQPYFLGYPNYDTNQLYQPPFPKESFSRNMEIGQSSQHSINLSNILHSNSSPEIQERLAFKQEQMSEKLQEKDNEKQESFKSKSNNLINLPFVNCLCEGKDPSIDGDILSCPECKNQFHKKCLQLQEDTIMKPCPLCTVTKRHIFTKLATKPITSGWYHAVQNTLNIKKIFLNQTELKIFNQALTLVQKSDKYSIQLRILKISDKKANDRKHFRTSFILGMSQLRKLQARKWIQLKLKGGNQAGLVFYAFVCVCNKQKKELMQELLANETAHKISINDWLKKSDSIEINLIHPLTKTLIKYPIRGELCDHLQCEDLDYICDAVWGKEKGNKIGCSICNRQYTVYEQLIADQPLYKLISERKGKIEDNCQITGIKIFKSGEVEWKVKKKNEENEGCCKMINEEDNKKDESSDSQASNMMRKLQLE